MTAQTLERNHSGRLDSIPRTPRHDEPERMSLRTDLYLLGHDDDTGRPHLDEHTIATGLAAAVILELWNAKRIRLGWHGNPHHGTWQRNHTTITLINASATGDPINDTALRLLYQLGGTVETHQFIEEFATTNLYEQVRDHLVAARILRSVTRRRFWFFRTHTQLPARATYPVRAHARIRSVARLYRPHPQDTALTALATALGLTPYLRLIDQSVTGLFLQLADLIKPQHPIHDLTAIIAPRRLTYQ